MLNASAQTDYEFGADTDSGTSYGLTANRRLLVQTDYALHQQSRRSVRVGEDDGGQRSTGDWTRWQGKDVSRWRGCCSLSRMTRADRILDKATGNGCEGLESAESVRSTKLNQHSLRLT